MGRVNDTEIEEEGNKGGGKDWEKQEEGRLGSEK